MQGNDRISGNAGDDVLSGDAPGVGDRTSFDWVWGGDGNDKITGGDSRDRLHGGRGNDEANGNGGRDIMSGGEGDDLQNGGNGNDRIFANLGADTTNGGDGNDDLWALARGDVSGPNDLVGDTLNGDAGKDTFHVRDGEQDNINCGEGRDVVIADRLDVVDGSCEVTRRADPKPREDAQENATQAPREDADQT